GGRRAVRCRCAGKAGAGAPGTAETGGESSDSRTAERCAGNRRRGEEAGEYDGGREEDVPSAADGRQLSAGDPGEKAEDTHAGSFGEAGQAGALAGKDLCLHQGVSGESFTGRPAAGVLSPVGDEADPCL